MRTFASVACCLACSIIIGCQSENDSDYPMHLRVERVEGDTARFTVQQFENMPLAARVVHPPLGCKTEENVGIEDFSLNFFSDPEQPTAVILRSSCNSIPPDPSRDRCYRITIDGPAPLPVPCKPHDDALLVEVGYDPEQYKGGRTRKYSSIIPAAGLKLVISDEAVPGSSFGGGFFGGGTRGPYVSHLEVFDEGTGTRVFHLSTTKGLRDLRQTSWLAVGKRVRIITMLSETHTVFIDIKPAPGL